MVAHSIQFVLPRVDDCSALILGSRQQYLEQSILILGTYWYSQDFLERKDESGQFSSKGLISNEQLSIKYDTYIKKYGQNNADYLIEILETRQTYYQREAFINFGVITNLNIENDVEQESE